MQQLIRMIIISLLAGIIGIGLTWFGIGFCENIKAAMAEKKLKKKLAEEQEAAESEEEEDEEAGGIV